MTTTPFSAFSVASETWRPMLSPRPLPTNGGNVRDLLHFLRTQDILDDKELAAFAADVEAGRKAMNQLPARSPWDS